MSEPRSRVVYRIGLERASISANAPLYSTPLGGSDGLREA